MIDDTSVSILLPSAERYLIYGYLVFQRRALKNQIQKKESTMLPQAK
jgi:hypothetical protein